MGAMGATVIEFWKDGELFEVTRITFHGDGVSVEAEHRRVRYEYEEPKTFEVTQIKAMDSTLESTIRVLQGDSIRGLG